MSTVVEGNKTYSEVVKEKGQVMSHSTEQDGSGKLATHCQCGNLRELGFKAGRTIELRRFEFCRVGLGVRVRVPKGVDAESVRDALENFVLELLNREESAVAGEDHKAQISKDTTDTLSVCVCRCINVAYGLTLKSGTREYESHQVDLLEELGVSNGADILSEFEKLSEEMASYLDKQHKRIKNVVTDTGL